MGYWDYRHSHTAKMSALLQALCNLSDEKLKECGLPNDTHAIVAFMISDYGIEGEKDGSSLSLDDLNITDALRRALFRAGIASVNQLLLFSKNDLLFLRGIGKERANQIEKALHEKELCLRGQFVYRKHEINEDGLDEEVKIYIDSLDDLF